MAQAQAVGLTIAHGGLAGLSWSGDKSFVPYGVRVAFNRLGDCKICKDPMLFDLVSYCDVRVQSNPFILKETSVY